MNGLERIVRVADQMCTGYGHLRDLYASRARLLDIFILAASSWLLAVTFVEPDMARKLSPLGMEHQIWIGVLSVSVFVLALIQSRVDWKAKSDSYQRALHSLSEIVLEGRQVLGLTSPPQSDIDRLFSKYHSTVRFIEPLPDSEFLALKKRHKIKVAISKILDDRPGTSIALLRIQIWWRDNVRK